MNRSLALVPILLLGAALRLQGAPQEPGEVSAVAGGVEFTPEELERILTMSPLPPPPPDPTNAVYESEAAARLGQALFYDTRLSENGEISCATCHLPDDTWADGRQLAEGLLPIARHTMSLWNVAYNRWFFWDGRRDTLWSQAITPLESHREHGSSRLAVTHLVTEDPDYVRAYRDVFGEPPDISDRARFPDHARPVLGEPEHEHSQAWDAMTPEDQGTVNRVFTNVGKSIAAFERGIVSRNAPFDVFVEGLREGDPAKQRDMTESAKRGLQLFLGRARCHFCHSGPEFSNLEFHNDRVAPLEGGSVQDLGRYVGVKQVRLDPFNGVGEFSDAPEDPEASAKIEFLFRTSHNLSEFKTPSLRNVAVTAPYMHEGQLLTLEDVLEHYSTLADAVPLHKGNVEKLLQPLHLTDQEKADLIAFLESLTDTKLDERLKSAPATPYQENE